MTHRLIKSFILFSLFVSTSGFATTDLNSPVGDAKSVKITPFGGEWPLPLQVENAELTDLQGIWQVVGERLILTIEEEKWEYLGLTVGNVRVTSLDKKKIVSQGFGFMVNGTLRGVIAKEGSKPEYFSVGRGIHSVTGEHIYYFLRGATTDKMEFFQLIP